MEDTWSARFAPLGVVVTASVAAFGLVPPLVGITLVLVALGVAWRSTPGFWGMISSGLVGGVVAGLLILGPGFRLAMRVVAILDPFRVPAFTVEGTGFVMVAVGVIMGALQAATANLIRHSLRIESTRAGGILLGLVAVGLLLVAPPDIRSELFELGVGAVVNIPMFGGICLAYGLAAVALADRIAARSANRRSIEAEAVAA